MNPPFYAAQTHIYRALEVAEFGVYSLLRLNFLGSQKRKNFFENNEPDVLCLSERPSFDGKGTDRTEYSWFHWNPKKRRKVGTIQHI